MKKLALALVLLQTSFLLAAADKPNPTDFPMTIHILSSECHTGYGNGLTYTYQVVHVVIDGQPLELTANAGGVLALGDYPARVSPSIHSPKSWSAYDIVKGYDFLMPDSKTRTFVITAMGSATSPTPTNP
jgi:hypothetical protein